MNPILKNNKVLKIIIAGAIISFLWINIFGLVYYMNEMRVGAKNSNCLFSGQTKECTMNFSEHVNIWHEMFTILPQNIFGFTSTLILFIILALTFIFWRNYFYIFSQRIYYRYKLYLKQHPQINLFNYLEEVFSSGILNKKIYKLAII